MPIPQILPLSRWARHRPRLNRTASSASPQRPPKEEIQHAHEQEEGKIKCCATCSGNEDGIVTFPYCRLTNNSVAATPGEPDPEGLCQRPRRRRGRPSGGCGCLSAEIRRGRSDPGSSPWSTPPRSLSRTSPSSPRTHRLPRGLGAGSANRRSGRHGCRST